MVFSCVIFQNLSSVFLTVESDEKALVKRKDPKKKKVTRRIKILIRIFVCTSPSCVTVKGLFMKKVCITVYSNLELFLVNLVVDN